MRTENLDYVKGQLKAIVIDLEDELDQKVKKTSCIKEHLKNIKERIKEDEAHYSGFLWDESIYPDMSKPIPKQKLKI